MKKPIPTTASVAAKILLGAGLLGSLPLARAAFHVWAVNEIYSNDDGSVQFVEFSSTSAGQEFLAGQTITCSGPLGTRSYRFPSSLPTGLGTAGRTFIVGTSNLINQPGGLRPDYVFTNSTPFLFLNAGAANTVTLLGAITPAAVYTNLPTDGSRSMLRTGSGTTFATVATNSPKNYSNIFNTLVPSRIASLSAIAGNLVLSFATATGTNGSSGPNYTIETVGQVDSGNWTVVTNVTGNGAVRNIALPIGTQSNRFFRLRVP